MKTHRAASLLLIALGMAAVYASLTFLNTTWWRVNASLPPVLKDFNSSLHPLARGWYVLSDVNTTYYYMKFMPGWPEQYVVGQFRARDPGWQARLVAVGRSGSGTYAISLGGRVQITNTQDAGPFVPTTAPLVWTMTATTRYSVLARAIFQQGGITAWQFVNFTAEPMSQLAKWTFSCPGVTYTYPTCTGSQTYSDSLAYSSRPAYITEYTVYSSETVTSPVQYTGSSIRTQIDARVNGYGLSSVIYNVAQRWGRIPAGGAVVSVTGTYTRNSDDARNNVAYLSIGVDTNNDSAPDLEIIAYVYDTATANGRIYSILVDQGSLVTNINSGGDPTSTPGASYGLVKVQSVTSGTTFTITVYLPALLSGYITSVAMAVVDPSGSISGSPAGDFWVGWTNLVIRTPCSNTADSVTRGRDYTSVWVAPGDYLATEVDAYGMGNPFNDYGIAAGVLSYVFNGTGASISATASYYRDPLDTRNNVVYIAVLVDENYDGAADREYVYYYYDTAGGNGVIVSPFTNQVVCTVSTAGACTPASARYVATRLGGITDFRQSLSFSILNIGGAVQKVALAVTDGRVYDSNVQDDVQVLWRITITHYSCPPPSGWLGSATYFWQTNYFLFVANGAAYTPLVSGGLTYISNFTGSGLYAVFDSSLSPIFGVYKAGSSFSALCGSFTPLGVFPAAAVVELRPLSGFGDVIVRDSDGNILARYGCRYAATPAYVGYRTQTGEYLRAYRLEVWG
ncbi:hypothetical protein Pogu_0097 [Pyrobaculum oguniense TE7]|uniref:Uncharacterized protein n=1 Tax=Pyrobaculum oguniense (strain DSM 13380 / JCM 10595 / TE7) TaxID=698757 RepID=H6Q6G6_PYROT|nr:hypothetical protein Pogu_0097 [Pyrobaculum oguniense TE7]